MTASTYLHQDSAGLRNRLHTMGKVCNIPLYCQGFFDVS